jgi:hypothetical protein
MLAAPRRSRPAAPPGHHPRQPGRTGTEASEQGWLGELEGLQVSLATVRGKLQALDARTARQPAATDLGMPSFTRIAGRAAAPATQPPGKDQTP